jgi:hypothetical protein
MVPDTTDNTSILYTTQRKWTTIAYQHAGIVESDWQPLNGYIANRIVMNKLYYYYQQLYFKNPDHFLWCGLARLTGGQVLYGMDNLIKICKDPSAITIHITAIAKDIFDAMAWQHELFIADPLLLLSLCKQLDRVKPATHAYQNCWETILNNTEEDIAKGNKMLLENEQHNTVQPHYEEIRKDAYSVRYFRFTRFVMRNIHPYHKRFIFSVPFKDVTVFKYRWQWIEGEKGMWHTWCLLSQRERDRLVGLSNEQIKEHRW